MKTEAGLTILDCKVTIRVEDTNGRNVHPGTRPLCKYIYVFVLSKPLLISVLFSLFVLPLRAEHNNIF